MDMILCDARGYSIKYAATRKRNNNRTKQEKAQQLEDAVTLLELDNGQDSDTTNRLMDDVNTLRDTIQAQNDYEEQEAARKYMAKRNLEAETPTKNFCNQIKKPRKKVKLEHFLKKPKTTLLQALRVSLVLSTKLSGPH